MFGTNTLETIFLFFLFIWSLLFLFLGIGVVIHMIGVWTGNSESNFWEDR